MKYILRLCVVRNGFDDYIKKILQVAKKYKIDEIMLCEDNAYIGAIAQPLEEHGISADYCKKAVEYLNREGFKCSFYLKSLVGHITSDTFALPFQKFVGTDGVESKSECCLLDENFSDYAAKVLLLYAKCGFSAMMLDDDFRSVNHCNGRDGCICELHLQKTSELCGRKITRGELAAVISGCKQDEEVFSAFKKANFEGQLKFLEKIEKAVHIEYPDIRLGLMCSGVDSDERQGRDMSLLLQTFAGKHKPFLRPPGGPYFDSFPPEYLSGFESKKIYENYLSCDADFISEVDVYSPRNIYTKSVSFLDLQMRLHALSGYDAVSLNVIDHYGNDPFLQSEYLEMLADNKSDYEKICRSIKGKKQAGIGFSAQKVYSQKMHGYNQDFPNYSNYSIDFMRLGLPVCFHESDVNFLAGDCIDKKSDSELIALLSKVLFLDYSAVCKLQERGLADYTGVMIKEKINIPCYEIMSNKEYSGEYSGLRFPVNVGNLYKEQNVYLSDIDGTAEELSIIANSKLVKIGAASVLYKNKSGGTVVSFLCDINNDNWLNRGRQKEIYSILKNCNKLPGADVSSSVNVVPFEYCDESGNTTIYLFNCSFDKKAITVKLKNKEVVVNLEPLCLKRIV